MKRQLIYRAATAALLVVPISALSTPPANADTNIVVSVIDRDNYPYAGIYLRNSSRMADVSRTAANYVKYGASVRLVCGAWGEAVGPNANRRWHRVRAANGTLGWIADRYLGTSNKANQATPGEPECSTTASADPKATAAVAWAKARVGSAAYKGACLSFTRQAWAAAGVNLRSRVGVNWGSNTYPADIWKRFTAGSWGAGTPPKAGALLFYAGSSGNRTTSHIAIWDGTRVISTDDSVGARVHYENFGQHGRYLGWWYPN